VADGPELNGEAKESPIPDPSAITMKETAMAASVPAIAALQENGECDTSSASGRMAGSTMTASLMLTSSRRCSLQAVA
jgi:hypothetical protein